ncbi:MAG: acetyl-CoA carboxylase carboxyltransferase subunit alpha [Candidatus Delongbacteria bacterium]|nr:acetyl-CoA carboxylase carboxyltransferase subunit alpha [Candidatus Delongbacteria bacterium]
MPKKETSVSEMEKMLEKLRNMTEAQDEEFSDQISKLEKMIDSRKEIEFSNLTPWETVQIARHHQRPVFADYITLVFTDFIELHGDRRFADDRGLIGGFARIDGAPVMLIGHNKGKNVSENVERNFGMAKPEGYRKALRLMKLAEKYNVPIISFIDTPGAFPGLEAEERGQAEAIARNLVEMAQIKVPIICVVSGEGGSGGALGIGVGDSILMLSHSIYSVISPEGCASIIWRDGAMAEKAAEALKITAGPLKELGIVDEIIEEPTGGAHNDYAAISRSVQKILIKYLKKYKGYSESKIIKQRFEKYSKIGVFNK